MSVRKRELVLLEEGHRPGSVRHRSLNFRCAPDGASTNVMPLRIFLVEDSPLIRQNLTATLEELAPVVVVGCAEDESSAVGWVAANPLGCDLMIIDVFLKSGSGLGVLGALAEVAVDKVAMSNYATPIMRGRCLDLGASRVFDKSSEIEALTDYCEALHQRSLLQ